MLWLFAWRSETSAIERITTAAITSRRVNPSSRDRGTPARRPSPGSSGAAVRLSGTSTRFPSSFTIRAGAPTTVALSGTSCMMITVPAPTRTLEPTVIGPSSVAAVPMNTLSPTVGCRFPWW